MADCGERIVDQVVVENGTSPLDDLYFRVGDAIASRNIHAAIYDGLRLAKDF